MLMRSGFFTRPKPLVEFDCGSQSTSSVLTSAAASEAARLMAVVVLPTPPFWLATAMTRPMILFLCVAGRICEPVYEINARFCANRGMFHVEHSRPRLPDFSAAQNFIAIRSVSCETLRHPLYVVYGGMKKTGVQFEKCFTWNVFTASHNETNNRVITTYHQLLDVKFALNIRVEAFLYNCFPLLLMYTNGQHSCT